jgi:site-specific recombinase XerD
MNFENYLQHKNIQPKTIARHQREVTRYTKWLHDNYDAAPEDARQQAFVAYLQHLKENRSLCNATLNQLLQILKNYHSYLAKNNDARNIAAFIKIRNAHKKQLQYIFTPDDLDELCDAYYHHIRNYIPSPKELRYCNNHEQLLQGRYIAVTLIAYQALQLQEIENLTPGSFDLRKGTVTVAAGRKGAKRTLALEPLQIGALLNFYNNNEQPLIPNRNHFEELSNTLKKLHNNYKDFRQLRASKITHWLQTHGLRKTQYMAGHRSIGATEKYQAGDLQTLQNSLNSFHPLQ